MPSAPKPPTPQEEDDRVQFVVDLSFLDAIFRGTCDKRFHLLLLGSDPLPGYPLLRLARAAFSITCIGAGALKLAERLVSFDVPTLADVLHRPGGRPKPLFMVGSMPEPTFNPVSGRQRPGADCLLRFGFKWIRSNVNTDLGAEDPALLLGLARETMEAEGAFAAGDTVIVDGALGGRFDQTAAAIAALYFPDFSAPADTHSKYQTILIGPETVCAYIHAGLTRLIPPRLVCGRACGLIPFTNVGQVSTRGLVRDFDKVSMSMAGTMSSVNSHPSEAVEIEASDPIVWYSHLSNLGSIVGP